MKIENCVFLTFDLGPHKHGLVGGQKYKNMLILW